MFVRTKSGLINTDHIKRVSENSSTGNYTVHFSDGEERSLDWEAFCDIARPLAVVPANPGFELLCAHFDEGDPEKVQIWRYPIVAWHISHDRRDDPIPVTPSGTFESDSSDRYTAIVGHGDTVMESENGSHRSLQDWIDDIKDRYRNYLAWLAANPSKAANS